MTTTSTKLHTPPAPPQLVRSLSLVVLEFGLEGVDPHLAVSRVVEQAETAMVGVVVAEGAEGFTECWVGISCVDFVKKIRGILQKVTLETRLECSAGEGKGTVPVLLLGRHCGGDKVIYDCSYLRPVKPRKMNM